MEFVVLQKLDITKPAKEIIVDKFNARTGFHLQYHFVELGTITPLAIPNDKENTLIELVPTVNAPFLNTFHLRYKRMELSDIFGAPYIKVPSNNNNTLYEILIDINDAVGINLTTDDVLDAPITVNSTDPTLPRTVVIKTKPTSVFYIGEVTLSLDVDLNTGTTSVESNSIVYALREVSNGQDYLTAHAFDGYRGNSFQFLRNVDLVTKCKIDSVFSCENTTLVLNGEFQFVATGLTFVNPASTYNTITINRVGNLLSARTTASLLSTQDAKITRDPVERCYYLVDTAEYIGQNPKHVYRLFENGTVDTNFNHVTLPNYVRAVIPARLGYFTVHQNGSDYHIRRFAFNGTVDANFHDVTVKSNSGNFDLILGYTSYSDTGEETLHMCMSSFLNSSTTAPTFTASQVNTVISSNSSAFYSPFFSISDKGDVVDASGELAQYNERMTLENSYWYPELFKSVDGESVVYALNSFGITSHANLIPLKIGSDKEYRPVFMDLRSSEQVVEVNKIFQTFSGHETYAAVKVIRKDNNPQNEESTAILSFAADHSPNGFIVTNSNDDETIKDVVVLNM